jgi:hypothetical protein
MATATVRRKSIGLAVAAWIALLLAMYSAFAVAIIWGFATGLVGAALGTWFSIWILNRRPRKATRVVAIVALGVNLLTLGGALLVVVLASV